MAITNNKKIEKISIAGHEIMVNSDKYIDLTTPINGTSNAVFRDFGDGKGTIYGTVKLNAASIFNYGEILFNAPKGYSFTSVPSFVLVGNGLNFFELKLYVQDGKIYGKTDNDSTNNAYATLLCNDTSLAPLTVTYDKF